MKKFTFYALAGSLMAAVILFFTGAFETPANESAASTMAAGAHSGPLKASPVKKCMNMGGAMEAPTEGEWGYTIRLADFRRIKQAGFDTVRVPIKFSAHAANTPPYRISPALFARTDEVVDWALAEGLQVIIDVHLYEELMRAPHIHERRLEAMWQQIAYHYALAPPQVIFELINEPNDKMTGLRTDALNQRLLKIVRKHNPARWVIVTAGGWSHPESLLQMHPPRDPYVMPTFHYYDPFDFTHQGAGWVGEDLPVGKRWGSEAEYAAIARDMAMVADWRDKTGQPVFMGEFGAITKADNASRARWTEAVRKEAEKNGIGWCYWDWATSFAVYDTGRERWDAPLRRALVGQ